MIQFIKRLFTVRWMILLGEVGYGHSYSFKNAHLFKGL